MACQLKFLSVSLFTLSLLLVSPSSQSQYWKGYGDLRLDHLFRDGEHRELNDVWRGRLRVGLKYESDDFGHWETRLATNYISNGENSEIDLSFSYPSADEVNKGFTTLDRFYWQKRWSKFDMRVGRFTHKSTLKSSAGLSFDSKNEIATAIDWTDGIELNYYPVDDWKLQFLLRHEAEDRPTSVRRSPLTFNESASRSSYRIELANEPKDSIFVQRTLAFSYFPDSLPRIENENDLPQLKDYSAVNGKLVVGHSVTNGRLIWGIEAGYLFKTPHPTTVGLTDDKEANEWSYQTLIGWQDFIPGHKIELNYSESSPAWFISPNFSPNRKMTLLSYFWFESNYFIEFAGIRFSPKVKYEEEARNGTDNIILLRWNLAF